MLTQRKRCFGHYCHVKTSIQQEEVSFLRQIRLKFKEETSEVLHLEDSIVWSWNLDALESRSEIPGKFLKCGRNLEVLHRVKEEKNILHTIKKKEDQLIDHALHRNCLIKHNIEGKMQGGIQTMGRKWRIRKQLLDDLKEMRGYRKLKVEALYRTSLWKRLWTSHKTDWGMNKWINKQINK